MNTVGPPAPRPCSSCPYRRDVPSGVWAREEYEKLRRYDAPTWAQPPALFLCHLASGRVCAGWAGCHDGDHLLSLRIAVADGRMTVEDVEATATYQSPVPLFATGEEAAAHGLAEVATPSQAAIQAMSKITQTRKDR